MGVPRFTRFWSGIRSGSSFPDPPVRGLIIKSDESRIPERRPIVRGNRGGHRTVTKKESDAGEVRQAVSAGGVVLRPTETGPEVVLCHRRSEGLWALPKGTPEPGETREETALREVTEETGLLVRSGPSVGETRYSFVRDGFLFQKVVYFFLMTAVGGDTDGHDHEFDVVEWVPVEQAIDRLTFKNESRILEKALPVEEKRNSGQAS